MQPLTPFFRESGAGPSVVCLHASAGSSSQWRALTELIAPRYHVLAVDSYGSGKTPAWPAKRPLTLRDEVALLEPVFARAREPFFLVAHSYGAAVAVTAALERPDRVRALALYEPTLFGLLDAESPPPNDADGFREAFAVAAAAFDAGDAAGAARCFVDYWSGAGAWDQMPEPRQGQVAVSMANLRGWADACFSDPAPLEAFSWLGAPVLYMIGKDSPASSCGVARLLTEALPRVEIVEFEGLGHMGPVTHPEIVNRTIFRFLERHRPLQPADLLRARANPSRADTRDSNRQQHLDGL
jgi:pimeloyl-ACP methyl ester carboxylesterase